MMICSGRNGNHSLFNVAIIMLYRLSLMSCGGCLSLSQAKTFLSDARQSEVDILYSWTVVVPKFSGGIVFIRVQTLSNTHFVASRYIKRENDSLPVDVRCSKTSLLKLDTLNSMCLLCIFLLIRSSNPTFWGHICSFLLYLPNMRTNSSPGLFAMKMGGAV